MSDTGPVEIKIKDFIKGQISLKGVSAKMVGNQIGLTQPSVSRLINNGHTIKMHHLRDILETLGESIVLTMKDGKQYKIILDN